MHAQVLFPGGAHKCQIGERRLLRVPQRVVNTSEVGFDVFPAELLVEIFQLGMKDVVRQILDMQALETAGNEFVQRIDQHLFAGDGTGLGADHQVFPLNASLLINCANEVSAATAGTSARAGRAASSAK